MMLGNDTDNQDNIELFRHLLTEALPLLDSVEHFQGNPLAKAAFERQLKCLVAEPGTRVAHSPEIKMYFLCLLRSNNEAEYKRLKPLLHLPDRRTVQRWQKEMFGDTQQDGVCKSTIKQKSKAWRDKGFSRKIPITYDSLKMTKNFLISPLKSDNGRIIGALPPDNLSVATIEFEKYLQRIAPEVPEGNVKAQDEAMLSAMEHTTEHTVVYAVPIDSRVSVKESFIAAKHNDAALDGTRVLRQNNEVMQALVNQGFEPCIAISDAASSNVSAKKEKKTVRAKDLLPVAMLSKHGLDGEPSNFLVAWQPWWSSKATPFVEADDPPHILKRVTRRMETHMLCWGDDQLPMSMALFKDIYDSVVLTEGGVVSLGGDLKKMWESTFEAGSKAQSQNVARSAKILSRMMYLAFDKVANGDPNVFKLATAPNINTPELRKAFFSKSMEMILFFDRWFDIMNSEEKSSPSDAQVQRFDEKYVTANKDNGHKLIDELLAFVRWLHNYKEACTKDGRLQEDQFLPMQLFDSLRGVCFGYAALICQFAIKDEVPILLKRFSQDICENHFGHVRHYGGGSSHAVNTYQASRSDDISNVMRTAVGAVSQSTNTGQSK